ncbi:MAG: polysaccharide deacetylase family protein [Anaerolineae bacterium]|nr:polysaccharide deacetylase family protein [Anaerolineae bacterium]
MLAAGGCLAWRRATGPARARWRSGARLAVCLLLAGALVAAGSWQLVKARSFQLFGELVARVDVGERLVALTLDDGPTVSYTGEVLDVLRAEGVPATFFVVGKALERNLDVCRAIVAEGHELGNHTYSHPHMVMQPYSTLRDEIERTDTLIRACGYEGEIHFRAPGGKQFLALPYYLARTGKTSIKWDVAPEGRGAGADEIVERVMAEVQPGSIILLHVMYESRAETRAALPVVIRRLKEEGYRFVTVSELLALDNER